MAGLFDTGGDGMDMESLMRMLNPMGTANAAEGGGGGAFGNTGGITPEQLINSQAAMRAPPEGGEINPNPVPAGTVPLPARNPLSATPEAVAGANRGLGAVPIQPGVPVGVPPSDVGSALTGSAGPTSLGGPSGPAPLPAGTSGSTDISAQAKGGEAATRPSLAQALKGVVAPAAPVQQKISSPNAPRPTGTIKAGELQALLMALNAGGGAPRPPVRLGG